MKKITFLLAMLTLSLTNIYGAVWEGYWGNPSYTTGDVSGTFLEEGGTGFGTGTQEDPYRVRSAADLAKLAQKVKTTPYAGKYFKLMVDIDLGNKLWFPIGTGGNPEHPFQGYFDGNNHIISNLKIEANSTTAADGCGLFGKANSGSIKNLGIKDVSITSPSDIQSIGGLVGNCGLNVLNCFIDNIRITRGMNRIGGLIGKCWENSFTNCYAVNVTLDAEGASLRGGLIADVGSSGNTFTNCYAANVVINNKPASEANADYLGTLAGKVDVGATFINCYADVSLCGAISGKAIFKRGDGTIITINSSNKTSNEFIKSTSAFAGGETAFLLNQYPKNDSFWSVSKTSANTVYPCFANQTNARVYRYSATAYIGNTATVLNYRKGSEPITSPAIAEESITAIQMTADSDIPESEFNSMIAKYGNANTLKYMPENSTFTGNNIIKGNTASTITLTDEKPFYCPIAIDNATVSYSRNFAEGWNTICLPFAYTIADNETDKIETLTDGTAEFVKFEYVTGATDANTPYLINIKNAGNKTFNATGVTIPASTAANNTSANGYTFTGIFIPSTITNGYGLVLDATSGSVMFKKIPEAGSNISSFRAYLAGNFNGGTPASAPLRIIHGDGGATNVEMKTTESTFQIYGSDNCINIICGKAQSARIYTIDGRLVKIAELNEGTNTINGMNKGIYLINNQKVIVK